MMIGGNEAGNTRRIIVGERPENREASNEEVLKGSRGGGKSSDGGSISYIIEGRRRSRLSIWVVAGKSVLVRQSGEGGRQN